MILDKIGGKSKENIEKNLSILLHASTVVHMVKIDTVLIWEDRTGKKKTLWGIDWAKKLKKGLKDIKDCKK